MEQEVLFAPLTGMEVIGEPRVENGTGWVITSAVLRVIALLTRYAHDSLLLSQW
jgi:hypothetical protein